jgi:signal transduction histidine kinase
MKKNGSTQLPGLIKGDRTGVHSIAFMWWYCFYALLTAGKLAVAPQCIPRYRELITWNGILFLLITLSYIILKKGIIKKRSIETAIKDIPLLAFFIYHLYEVELFLPILSTEHFIPGLFITLSLLIFSLVLAVIALYEHIIRLLFLAGVHGIYITAITRRIQEGSLFLTFLLLFQVLSLMIIFRSMKIIINQSARSSRLLRKQRALNQQIAASEKQLMDQGRLISIVRLSTGLNHDINNPLTYLKGNQYFLHKLTKTLRSDASQKEKGKALEQMEQILQEDDYGLEQITKVVERLKLFTSRSSSNPELFDIGKVLSSCIEIEKKSMIKRVRFIFKQDGPAKIFGRTADFMSISATLIDNCIASFPKAAEEVPGKEYLISVSVESDGQRLLVSISDNSPGIDPDILLDGTWMQFSIGIAMCKTILHEHGGTLKKESVRGEGTRYLITLPREKG